MSIQNQNQNSNKSIVLFENFFGDKSLILTIVALAPLMVLGIWIFPEVVTKKTTAGDGEKD